VSGAFMGDKAHHGRIEPRCPQADLANPDGTFTSPVAYAVVIARIVLTTG
jgi:hypothetical protein